MKRLVAQTPTLIILLAFGIVLTGCASSESTRITPPKGEEGEEINIGYGTLEKRMITGAVETVDVEAALKQPVARVSDILRGRVSGVIVTEGPGGTVQVRIRDARRRGTGPLYVIDGMPVTPDPGGALPWLNPQDIASITVLKDAAAAAIYGMRGANGVILITTKLRIRAR